MGTSRRVGCLRGTLGGPLATAAHWGSLVGLAGPGPGGSSICHPGQLRAPLARLRLRTTCAGHPTPNLRAPDWSTGSDPEFHVAGVGQPRFMPGLEVAPRNGAAGEHTSRAGKVLLPKPRVGPLLPASRPTHAGSPGRVPFGTHRPGPPGLPHDCPANRTPTNKSSGPATGNALGVRVRRCRFTVRRLGPGVNASGRGIGVSVP